MRYLGNKERMLPYIINLLQQHHINHCTLGDLFSGSGAVSDKLKGNYRIIANDYLLYASIFAQAKLNNSTIPSFSGFHSIYHCSPFTYFNHYQYNSAYNSFITNNYSPLGDRMFFTVKNANKIDMIRKRIGQLRQKGILNQNEFIFLLASLLESVMRVSNTSGTYGSYFKKWETRATKPLILKPLTLNHTKLYSTHNLVYNTDTNKLIRTIKGDVAYIDTPYTSLQYNSAYSVLDTIALNDYPKIHGKAGIRNDTKDNRSLYSQKRNALVAFEDLLRQLRFKHIIISYSTQSIIPLDTLVKLIKKFAVNHKVEVHHIGFREYENVKKHHNKSKNKLKEVLIYFNKDLSIIKSPLNYAGSKDSEMNKIIKQLPKHISNFVDCCGGAFNVGQNIIPTDKVYYNDNDLFIVQIVRMLLKGNKKKLIEEIDRVVKKYKLNQNDKKNYCNFRDAYNQFPLYHRPPVLLFVLSLYSFSHMIRFNLHGKFNSPIGKYNFNQNSINQIINYHSKAPVGRISCNSFSRVNINDFDKDTVFYFDPPYIITSATYNDGKRFQAQWTKKNEKELLDKLDEINSNGKKFILSNILKHRGRVNHILVNWLSKRNYKMINIGRTGRKYKRDEVIIKNY